MESNKRKPIKTAQKNRLLRKNADACCVCKSRGVGLNFHHIDGNPSNNVDSNIAVLCVKEHDCHHRPTSYPSMKHLDLSADEIKNKKECWEAFVSEAQKDNPSVLAVVTAYGSEENISGMKIVFQWNDGRIEFERMYQMLDAPMETWIDNALEEIQWVGKNVKLTLIDYVDPIEYCEGCKRSYSRVLDESTAIRFTAEDWEEKAVGTIYLKPTSASLSLTVFYGDNLLYQANIHKCGNDIHFMDDKNSERYPIRSDSSLVNQIKLIVDDHIQRWGLKKTFIGTGNPDSPEIINEIVLHSDWENLQKKKVTVKRKRTVQKMIRKNRQS